MSQETGSDLMTQFAPSGFGLCELTPRAIFELRGTDRQKFLHNFCTNEIKALQPGSGCEALMSSLQGKILAHLTIQIGTESLWIDASPTRRDIINQHLNKYLITEDVQILDRSDDYQLLLVCGTAAADRLRQLGLEVANEPALKHGSATLSGIDVVWQRSIWCSSPNWCLRVPASSRDQLWNQLVAAGAQPLSDDQVEALRIEAGMPRETIDFDDSNLAQELARTDRCISFRKGCYLGQEPIARIDSMGHVNQELRQIEIKGTVPPAPGTLLIDPASSKEVGRITSFSPLLNGQNRLALAMIRRGFFTPATQLTTQEGLQVQVTT